MEMRKAHLVQAVNNEKGVALVLALVLLFIMGLLGTLIFNTSSTEMQISRNYVERQGAFYAAERGVAYAQSDNNIYTTIGSQLGNSVNIPLAGVNLQAGNTDVDQTKSTVTLVSSGNPPRGAGVDVTQFQANYFAINVRGTGQGNSIENVEAYNARIVPKQ